jgi:signal transduction histidine kinase
VPSVLETDPSHLECQHEALSPVPKKELSQQDYRMLLATLAHDFKNALTRIRGRSQLLQRSLKESEPLNHPRLREGLAQIEVATRRMGLLLDELANLAATAGAATGGPRRTRSLSC